MLRHALAATCLAAAALTLPGCSGTSDADLVTSAQQFIDKKDYAAAVIQLKSALQQNPDSGQARLLMGRALLATGDPVAAVVELGKARELQIPDDQVVPDLARAMLQTGDAAKLLVQFSALKLGTDAAVADLATSVATAQLVQRDLDKARDSLARALQAQPEHAPALTLKARLLAADGDIDGAMALLDQVLGRNATDSSAGTLKGDLLRLARNDPAAALAAYRQVTQANANALQAHVAIMTLLLQQGKVEEARTHFAQMKKAAPAHPETLLFEGQLAFNDKEFTKVRQIGERVLKQFPDNVRMLELAGAAEFRLRAYSQAEQLLGRALKLAPGLPLSRHLLAQTYLRTGQPTKAIEALQPVIDGPSPDGTSLALAGEAWLQMGDAKKSDAAFARAAKVAPADNRVRTSAALAQMSQGNNDGAVAQLESIAAGDKGTRADLALISGRLRQNDLPGALKAIDGLARKIPDDPLADNLRGRVLMLKRDPAAAGQAFEAALKKDPTYYPAVAGMAALELGAGKPDDARKRFEALLQAQPKNHRSLLALADLSARTGAPSDEVTALLRRAVQANAGEAQPHLALIAQLLPLDAKLALTAAREAAAALPDNPAIQDALGRSQIAAGNAEQAVATFNQLATRQPTNPLHQVRLADALLANKDPAGAQRALRKALEIQPGLPMAQRGLVTLALMEKRPDDARALAREMQKKNPKDPMGFALEGDVEASRRSWDAAIAAYRSASNLAKSTEATVRLHSALRAAGKTADADRLSADWVSAQPKDAAFRFYLADLALARNELPTAEGLYRMVLELEPGNALAMNNVAWLMVKQSKPGALEMAQKANAALPGRPPLMDTLALALAANQQLPKALEIQKSAIARSPADPTLKLTLAKLLIQSGDKPYARAELEDLAKLGEGFRGQAEVAALLKTL